MKKMDNTEDNLVLQSCWGDNPLQWWMIEVSVGYIFNLSCLDSLYFVSAGALSTRLYTVYAVYVPYTFRTVLLSSTSLPSLVWLICHGGKCVTNTLIIKLYCSLLSHLCTNSCGKPKTEGWGISVDFALIFTSRCPAPCCTSAALRTRPSSEHPVAA